MSISDQPTLHVGENNICHVRPSSVLPDLKVVRHVREIDIGIMEAAALTSVALVLFAPNTIWSVLCIPLIACSTITVLIAGLQIPFTVKWSESLWEIHHALLIHTNRQYPVSPNRALAAAYTSSPLIPIILLIFSFDMLHPLAFPSQNVIANSTLLFLLFLFANGASVASAWANVHLLLKLEDWVSERDNYLKSRESYYILGLCLTGPTWFALWTFPSPACLLFLVAKPICTAYVQNQLYALTDRLRIIMQASEPMEVTPEVFQELISAEPLIYKIAKWLFGTTTNPSSGPN